MWGLIPTTPYLAAYIAQTSYILACSIITRPTNSSKCGGQYLWNTTIVFYKKKKKIKMTHCWFVAFQCFLISCLGLSLLPDSLDSFLSSYKEYQVAAIDEALPNHLTPQLLTECLSVHSSVDQTATTLQHGKKKTAWLPVDDGLFDFPARRRASLVEETVSQLKLYADLLLDEQHRSNKIRKSTHIVGAEWWIQVRGSSSLGIDFHYDKDEGTASEKGIMRHALFNTITYLTDEGAPTIIFNMTTNGSVDFPRVPKEGVIVFPKALRHVIFKYRNNDFACDNHDDDVLLQLIQWVSISWSRSASRSSWW